MNRIRVVVECASGRKKIIPIHSSATQPQLDMDMAIDTTPKQVEISGPHIYVQSSFHIVQTGPYIICIYSPPFRAIPP